MGSCTLCNITHTHTLTEACAAHTRTHPGTHTCVHTAPQPEHTHHLLSARIFVMEALKVPCLNPSPKELKRPFRGRRLSPPHQQEVNEEIERARQGMVGSAGPSDDPSSKLWGEEGTGQPAVRGFAGATEPWGGPTPPSTPEIAVHHSSALQKVC